MSKAVVLLSGGLDSATTLAIARSEGFDVYAISFDYGQRHRVELDRGKLIAKSMGAVDRKVIKVDLAAIGGSALTADIAVPKASPGSPVAGGVPVTYVPARNTIFLSLALGYAETLGAADIFIGVNALDYSGYPDCRPGYIKAFETMANLATKAAVEGSMTFGVHTPLINMTKKEIIETGTRLGVDFALTVSCYDPGPDGEPCTMCDSCRLRARGFKEAGVADPALRR